MNHKLIEAFAGQSPYILLKCKTCVGFWVGEKGKGDNKSFGV